MIGFIFSYKRSAAVLLVMTVLCALVGTIGGIYATQTYLLVLRICAVVVVFVLSYIAAFFLAEKAAKDEIRRLGGEQCRTAELCTRLNKVRRRCFLPAAKAFVQLEYAEALIYRGQFRQAELTISDTLALGVSAKEKAYAQILLAYLTFLTPDPDRFVHHYDRAVRFLKREMARHAVSPRDIAQATAQLAALDAMNAAQFGKGDAQSILQSAVKVPGISKLQALNLRALAVTISNREGKTPDADFLQYLKDNGGESGYSEIFRYRLPAAEEATAAL